MAESRHEELVALVGAAIDRGYTDLDDDAFNRVALEVFHWQYLRIEPYRRLCDAYQRTPETVDHWALVPAVPAEAFKDHNLFTYASNEAVRIFRTSGTLQGFRGNHFFRTLRVYDRALWSTFEQMLLPDSLTEFLMLFLVQQPSDAPDSSLSHMLGTVAQRLDPGQRPFLLTSEGLDVETLERRLEAAEGERIPALICTTAFALARYFETSMRTFALPQGSRLMETGGFKGHSTAYNRETLYQSIAERFGLPESHIISEYGMTELSSQCYSGSLRAAVLGDVPATELIAPPWMPVRVVDPDTGEEVARGDPGLIQFFDLANVDSVSAIYTSDTGRMRERGAFELLGRLEGAEARGCSLAAAEILGEVMPEDELED